MLAEAPSFEKKDAEKLRAQLGLDRPLHEQYLVWVSSAVRGDLGKSLWKDRPVTEVILERLPITVELAVLAMSVSTFLAIVIGVISATRQDTPIDYIVRLLSIGGLSVPEFWVATLIVVFPAVWFGYMAPLHYTPLFKDPWANLQQFVLPAVALGAAGLHSNCLV